MPLRSAFEGTLIVPGINALRLPGSLVVGEEENPVVANRSADGASELVLPEDAPRWRKVVARVEIRIAQKIECVAVECIAARFGDDVDLPAAEFSVLSIEVAGNNAEFVNRIQVRYDRRSGIHVLFDIGAIHAEKIGKLPLSIHRDCARIKRSRRVQDRGAHILHGGGSDRCLRGHSWLQRKKVCITAPIERHSGYLSSGDHLAKLGARGLHPQGIVADAHRLGNAAHFE